MKNLKVVYLTTSFQSIIAFGKYQVEELEKLGYHVFVVCGNDSVDDKLVNNAKFPFFIKQLNRNISIHNDLISFFSLIKFLFKTKPRMIIYSTPKAAFLGSLAAYLLSIEFRIYQSWGLRWQNMKGLDYFLLEKLEKITIHCSTNVIVVSNSLREIYKKIFKKKTFIVLGNGSTAGLNIDIFYPTEQYKNNEEFMKVGYAGRFSKDKGIHDLVDIFKNLQRKYPSLLLELVGKFDLSDPIDSKYKEMIFKDPNIRVIDYLSEEKLAQVMRNWIAQIFLSKREGLGNVILEAGACGIPTFCWNLPGIVDAIPNFAQKFMVTNGDFESLEAKILSYLQNPLSREEIDTLSSWYRENFNRNKVLLEFGKFITTICEE